MSRLPANKHRSDWLSSLNVPPGDVTKLAPIGLTDIFCLIFISRFCTSINIIVVN